MTEKAESAEDARIRRIGTLLGRLEEIPRELDRTTRRLYAGNMDAREFATLVDRRNTLLIEKERVEKELRETYRMKV